MSKLSIKAGRPSSAKTTLSLDDVADKTSTVRVNFDLDKAMHTRLKIYAAQSGKSIADVLREAVASLV